MITACAFIKDNLKGGFCLYESMFQLLPVVDKMIIMDLGSTDGTYNILSEISESNKKVSLVQGDFYKIDAGVFADLANDLIELSTTENVLYFQADEVFHNNVIDMMIKKFQQGIYDLSFWRIQFKYNFQHIKWFPHVVHRVGKKDRFNFVGDGMNTDRYLEPIICSKYGGEYFPRWGGMSPSEIPVNEMITDVSLIGAFRDLIPERKKMHVPFWNEQNDIRIEDLQVDDWHNRELKNSDWDKIVSPFDIPDILKYHLGKHRYSIQPGIISTLKEM